VKAMRWTVVLLAVGLLFAAVSAWSAEEEIAFETIALKHLTAGEVAPLIGGKFQFIGRAAGRAAVPEAGGPLEGMVHEGVLLVTAGGPLSHCLLVGGTSEGIAQLRELLAALDHRAPLIPVTITVYPPSLFPRR